MSKLHTTSIMEMHDSFAGYETGRFGNYFHGESCDGMGLASIDDYSLFHWRKPKPILLPTEEEILRRTQGNLGGVQSKASAPQPHSRSDSRVSQRQVGRPLNSSQGSLTARFGFRLQLIEKQATSIDHGPPVFLSQYPYFVLLLPGTVGLAKLWELPNGSGD